MPYANYTFAFVVNEARFFLSHRLALAQAVQALGGQTLLICAPDTGEAAVREQGIAVHTCPLSRSGFNPIEEWRSVRALGALYARLQPDVVHHVTIKPVLYGTRAARRQRIPAVVNAVPGMGFMFTRRGVVAALRRVFVRLLYRWMCRHPNMRVIFQNREDMEGLVRHRVLDSDQCVLVRGSGVDTNSFVASQPPEGPPVFLLVGRMLKDKGVREFATAAQTLKARHPDWRFQLLGNVDPGNPSALTASELQQWTAVEWLGFAQDVRPHLAASHVVVLPSYREGLPKTLLEAAACGRPMVASDIAGCREVVRDNVTGLLVPPRDADALTHAMEVIGLDEAMRQRMGAAARIRAESVFSIEDVVEHTLRVYDQVLAAQ